MYVECKMSGTSLQLVDFYLDQQSTPEAVKKCESALKNTIDQQTGLKLFQMSSASSKTCLTLCFAPTAIARVAICAKYLERIQVKLADHARDLRLSDELDASSESREWTLELAESEREIVEKCQITLFTQKSQGKA